MSFAERGILCSEHLVMFWVVVLPLASQWSKVAVCCIGGFQVESFTNYVSLLRFSQLRFLKLRLICGRRFYVLGMYGGAGPLTLECWLLARFKMQGTSTQNWYDTVVLVDVLKTIM